MTKLIFKPEMFNHRTDNPSLDVALANIANAFLEDWLQENGVRVYGNDSDLATAFTSHKMATDTHQAILVCVEEIKKERCVHANIQMTKKGDTFYYRCMDCLIKLNISWDAVEA